MKNIPEIRFPEFSEEWVEKKLGKLTKIYDGTHQTPKYTEEGIPFLSVENITQNNFENTKFISKEAYAKEFKNKEIEKGDILITRIGDIGSAKYFDKDTKAGYYVSVALIKHSNEFFSKFILFYIQSPYFQKELYKRTLHIAFPKKINLNGIGKCKIKLPPTLAEQEKIAKFLSSIDEKIEITAKKIEKLKLYKKGLFQKMLNVTEKGEPELRFKEFSGKWVEKRLGELIKERNEKTTINNQYPILTSSKEGIFFQNEYFSKQTASENNIGYKIIHYGDFTYRSMSDSGNFTFNIQNLIDKGIVSPAYPVFKVIEEKANSLFIYYSLNNSINIKKQIAVLKQGGTRLALNINKLKQLKLYLPPTLAEQEKIAEFLSSIDKKIELEENRLEKLKEYKKGLLQKMFV